MSRNPLQIAVPCALLLATLLLVAPGPALAADEDTVTRAPTQIEDVAVAGGGQFLVLKLKGEHELAVYDTTEKKITRMLRLPSSDFVFGAGGDTVVVFLPKSNELQSWSLKTFDKVKSKEFADPINVLRIVMGHSRSDLAFLRIARGTEAQDRATNHLLDVTTLTLLKPQGTQLLQGTPHTPYRDGVHYRANADMSRISEWASSVSPSGIAMFVHTEKGYVYRRNHSSAGYLAMGDDGRIYSGHGNIFVEESTPERPHDPLVSKIYLKGQSLIPGLGAHFFLGLQRDGKLDVYQQGQTTPLCSLGAFADWTPPKQPDRPGFQPVKPQDDRFAPAMAEEWMRTPLTLDKRVLFAPALDCVVFLPRSDDRIIQRKFNLKGALDKTGSNYLLVLSSPPVRVKAGAEWKYQMNTLAKAGPVKFRLEQGPEGMTLSPEGLLKWKVPAGVEGRGKVVLAVFDGVGETIKHTFTIQFD